MVGYFGNITIFMKAGTGAGACGGGGVLCHFNWSREVNIRGGWGKSVNNRKQGGWLLPTLLTETWPLFSCLVLSEIRSMGLKP
ncbi:hypothetical protein L2E82_46969 [Cichorium intybus]|uniref:Uncharacterized protein n=1 Tax=Cichorium intybus TaxID=13427 RepID=A0ACB8YV81_CICIN|nr:hypothetical protein L2E82_46969 [Cichorium intybus]